MNLTNATTATSNALSAANVLLVNEGLSVVAGILILVIGWICATWAKRLTERGLARVPLDLTLKPLIASLIRYVILAFTVVLVLGQFGVQTTSLIAVLGAAGLAIGLALQGTLSNVAAGVMLLVLRPFRVGHFVQAGGQSGTVREIGLFTTIMTTRDMIYVSVPNSAVWSGVIINYTREPLRRLNFDLPVDFANDLDKVESTIRAALDANAHVLKSPEPWAGIVEMKEFAVVIGVRCFIKSEDYWQALPSVQRDVKLALDKADILLAVTRQAVAVRNEPETRLNRVTPSGLSETRPAAAEQNPARRNRA
jgi:small conductance mechanosensitive channel